MLNTIKNIKKEFNLLYLDNNEYLFESIPAYLVNINPPETNCINRYVNQCLSILNKFDKLNSIKKTNKSYLIKGNLHFTTHYFIFQPDEIELPLIKIKYIDSVNEFDNTSELKELDKKINLIEVEELEQALNNIIKVNTINNYNSNNQKKSNFKESIHSNKQNQLGSFYNNQNANIKARNNANNNVTSKAHYKRYNESFPLHYKIIDFDKEFNSLLLKINKDKHVSNKSNVNISKKNANDSAINTNNSILNSRIELKLIFLKRYFEEKGYDCKKVLDFIISYYLSSFNKDCNYISYCFNIVKSSMIKLISRTFYKNYYLDNIKEDKFCFIIESKRSNILGYINLIEHVVQGYKNNKNYDIVTSYINNIFVNKEKEMERNERKLIGNNENTNNNAKTKKLDDNNINNNNKHNYLTKNTQVSQKDYVEHTANNISNNNNQKKVKIANNNNNKDNFNDSFNNSNILINNRLSNVNNIINNSKNINLDSNVNSNNVNNKQYINIPNNNNYRNSHANSLKTKSYESLSNKNILYIDENYNSNNTDISNSLIETNEQVFKYNYFIFRLKASRIIPEGIQMGIFVIKLKKEIVYWPIVNNYKYTCIKINLERIKAVLPYRYLHNNTAIKIISYKSSREKIFNFDSEDNCYSVLDYLKNNCPNLDYTSYDIGHLQNSWQMGRISNFDYILQLNIISSRSFCDLSQYPIFPWTIIDFSSETLDFEDSSIYRDMKEPIGNISNGFKKERVNKESSVINNEENADYFYNTMYSNSQIVNHFLIRNFPLLSLNYEEGKFGVEERLFKSIEDIWEFIMSTSTDLRELIPEFYCGDGNFLITCNNIQLESKNNCNKNSNLNNISLIDNINNNQLTEEYFLLPSVNLPKWAKSHYDIIKTFRSALESNYVSKNLHHWIDLIFGYKSSGVNAKKFNNLFDPLVYPNFKDNLSDTKQFSKEELKIILLNFGQVPDKLFYKEHPVKIVGEELFKEHYKNSRNDKYMQIYHEIDNKNNDMLIKILKLKNKKEEEKIKLNNESKPKIEKLEDSIKSLNLSLKNKENEFNRKKYELNEYNNTLKKQFNTYDIQQTNSICKWINQFKADFNKELLQLFPDRKQDINYIYRLENKQELFQIKAFDKLKEIKDLEFQISKYKEIKEINKKEILYYRYSLRVLPYDRQVKIRKEVNMKVYNKKLNEKVKKL